MKKLKRPILKFEIEEAQKNSISANEAARYLGVNIKTYKKYAKFYGIYENLLNQRGVGVAKGYAKSTAQSAKLKDIFENKHSRYPLQRLKWRMINRGLITDTCMSCGFDESRITDNKKPIILTFKDKLNDYTPTNLVTLCYNCCFLLKDAPTVVNRNQIRTAVTTLRPEYKTDSWVDPSKLKTNMGKEPIGDLTDEDIKKLKEEINKELGR